MSLHLQAHEKNAIGHASPTLNEFEKCIHKAWGNRPVGVIEAQAYVAKWIEEAAKHRAISAPQLFVLQTQARELLRSLRDRGYSPLAVTVEVRGLMKAHALEP